ncbi:hypothetical protein C0992_001457 [Termitomyces sp. T32_za158]|nr:hypothetical protein C0992_001457 [Termitomyces sp. T32_za158]
MLGRHRTPFTQIPSLSRQPLPCISLSSRYCAVPSATPVSTPLPPSAVATRSAPSICVPVSPTVLSLAVATQTSPPIQSSPPPRPSPTTPPPRLHPPPPPSLSPPASTSPSARSSISSPAYTPTPTPQTRAIRKSQSHRLLLLLAVALDPRTIPVAPANVGDIATLLATPTTTPISSPISSQPVPASAPSVPTNPSSLPLTRLKRNSSPNSPAKSALPSSTIQ